MSAYYNEIDPFAAQWLRELIKARFIADGEVDERSIADVRPSDLKGFVQCHFFAGIGGWSYALRLADWPDERRVWTGSCPCQPFSSAGRGDGPNDSRHFWPTWFRLIQQRRPYTVFGEQVASADGRAWLDAVSTDLEADDYAIGAVDLPACSIGAPHGRQRLWFVAESTRYERQRNRVHLRERQSQHAIVDACGNGSISALDNAQRVRTGRAARGEGRKERGPQGAGEDEGRRVIQTLDPGPHAVNVADAERLGLEGADDNDRSGGAAFSERSADRDRDAGPTCGFWRDAEWLAHRDGKARPIEPGTFPLAHGIPARVGRLRGYGNAIVPQVAQAFIEAYLDTEAERRTA